MDVYLTVVEIVETLFVPLASVQDLLDVEVSPSVTAENRSLWWARSGLQTKAETNPFILCNFRKDLFLFFPIDILHLTLVHG